MKTFNAFNEKSNATEKLYEQMVREQSYHVSEKLRFQTSFINEQNNGPEYLIFCFKFGSLNSNSSETIAS